VNARCHCGRVYAYTFGAAGCSPACRYDWEAAQVPGPLPAAPAPECGELFRRFGDGLQFACVLPAGHVTPAGEPSAHAWGPT
jgi:hypothetical protein